MDSINISWISWVLDVGNIHEIHHLMFFRMTCHGWPPGNIPRNDGSFVSALVWQSHDHWPIGGTRVAEVLPSQNADEKHLNLVLDKRLQLHRRPLRQVTSFDMF